MCIVTVDTRMTFLPQQFYFHLFNYLFIFSFIHSLIYLFQNRTLWLAAPGHPLQLTFACKWPENIICTVTVVHVKNLHSLHRFTPGRVFTWNFWSLFILILKTTMNNVTLGWWMFTAGAPQWNSKWVHSRYVNSPLG